MLALLVITTLLPLAFECNAAQGYQSLRISGHLRAGETFHAPFGGEYAFTLEPSAFGWIIEVRARGRDENLARLTPPWHFVPNPRYLEGWHFRNRTNTAPNDGSVNAPQEHREFYFSPDVGRILDYAGSATPPSVVDRVRAFGRGQLALTEYRLTPFDPGARGAFVEISFEVCLVWRASAPPHNSPGRTIFPVEFATRFPLERKCSC